jgi:hypothetical protein
MRRQKPLNHAIEHPLMLSTHDFKVLRLGEEHLVRVLARRKHACAGGRVHAAHLSGHLVCGVVVSEDEAEDGAETKEIKEVPRGEV